MCQILLFLSDNSDAKCLIQPLLHVVFIQDKGETFTFNLLANAFIHGWKKKFTPQCFFSWPLNVQMLNFTAFISVCSERSLTCLYDRGHALLTRSHDKKTHVQPSKLL